MANKIRINYPNYAKGEKVHILHVGEFSNGVTSSVSDEQVATYQIMTGNEWPSSGLLSLPAEEVKIEKEGGDT